LQCGISGSERHFSSFGYSSSNSFGNVARHKEGVAAACYSTSDGRDFAEAHEAMSELAHDLEIEIGRAQIAPHFPPP
jgi:hypothetical protein